MSDFSSDVSRRDFLKKAGAGALSVVLAPGLTTGAIPTAAGPRAGTNFYFLALSDAAVVDGIAHRMLMGGDGMVRGNNVAGGGSFQHQNAAGDIPQQILGEGGWKATKLLSFDRVGNHGVGVAGVLTMEVVLVPTGGGSIPAMLEVVCNVPPAGLFTGKAEGYTLSIPGAPFGPFTALGPPPLGITWFTTAVEPR